MDDFIASLIVALVQGLTEWLPVSSSGHLVLIQNLLDFSPGLAFDVALHFGTLMAVFVYFGKDITDIIESLLKRQFKSENGKLGLLLFVSAIPAALIGFIFKKYFEAAFESILVVAVGFGITSLILLIASLDFNKNKKISPSYKDALLIGLAQAFAIFPGISRSGSTISAGLLRGLIEKSAMKFSFLMSIPVIFGAGILEIGNERLSPNLIYATLVAFIAGLLTIHFLLKVISKDKKNLRWFALYVFLLALAIGFYLLFLS